MTYFYISIILICAVFASWLIFRIRISRNDQRKAQTKWDEQGEYDENLYKF